MDAESLADLTALVSEEFQVEASFLFYSVPTFYLKQPQETKQPFCRLLAKLKKTQYLPTLRKKDQKLILSLIKKKEEKRKNRSWINWILFVITLGTTFLTGYLLSAPVEINPFLGGFTFMVTIMVIVGSHEMGHKLVANQHGVKTTFPYFIPGPPPIGTMGALIVQQEPSPNKDVMFDVSVAGPIAGFIPSVVALIVGLFFSPVVYSPSSSWFPFYPLILKIFERWMFSPEPSAHISIILHPIAFAGLIGLLVTMLNLLPATILDGGHIAQALFSEKTRLILTILSIVFLLAQGYLLMACIITFLTRTQMPPPLDNVSKVSIERKIIFFLLILILLLCMPLPF